MLNYAIAGFLPRNATQSAVFLRQVVRQSVRLLRWDIVVI